MKTASFYALIGIIIYSFVVTISLIIVQSDYDCIEFENSYLKEMNDIITNYADSTSDTGEFDEFIHSKAGQDYFKLYKELYDKE